MYLSYTRANSTNPYGYIRVSLHKATGWSIKSVDISVYIYHFVNKDALSWICLFYPLIHFLKWSDRIKVLKENKKLLKLKLMDFVLEQKFQYLVCKMIMCMDLPIDFTKLLNLRRQTTFHFISWWKIFCFWVKLVYACVCFCCQPLVF